MLSVAPRLEAIGGGTGGLRARGWKSFSKEYRNLEIEVEDMVERHKKSELDWLDEQIRKTTTWLKRIERLAQKMTACIEIGRGSRGDSRHRL